MTYFIAAVITFLSVCVSFMGYVIYNQRQHEKRNREQIRKNTNLSGLPDDIDEPETRVYAGDLEHTTYKEDTIWK